MAASFSVCNFLSFLLPTTPPPPPQQFNLPSSSSSSTRFPSQSQKFASSSLSSVICPSLAYANTLFFKSAYNVQVVVDDNEPEERLLNRFRREVMKTGVIQECKRRRFFENKQDERKRKSREAAKRNRIFRRPLPRNPLENKQDVPTTKKEEDDDNWDLPEENIPY
ncbi:30S ribosomal protein S21, chloroplastic [Senna tora]|uniref:30S ribosomal protein S21, chloroplastic n=1 Tax=Senna tora TaxID=362788 RepID=A0A834TCT6_9FABA|nr:30S ribosomal protein S21, chloroplastic [Senna tora]